MCTVSWLVKKDMYEVFFNRDEKRARKPARPPVVSTTKRTRIVAPRDGNFGGTWLGTNNYGITIGLLNHYGPKTRRFGATTSRGHLVLDLLMRTSAPEIQTRLTQRFLSQFRPSRLFIISFESGVQCYTWDGDALTRSDNAEKEIPLTSSSYDSMAVAQTRKETFKDYLSLSGKLNAHTLLKFHRSHEPQKGAFSVCMHRSDARTVSFSRITVRKSGVRKGQALFQYSAAPPCVDATASTTELSLLI